MGLSDPLWKRNNQNIYLMHYEKLSRKFQLEFIYYSRDIFVVYSSSTQERCWLRTIRYILHTDPFLSCLGSGDLHQDFPDYQHIKLAQHGQFGSRFEIACLTISISLGVFHLWLVGLVSQSFTKKISTVVI